MPKKKRKHANPKPTWGSLSCSFLHPIRFQRHSEGLSFILEPIQELANITLPLVPVDMGRELSWKHPVCPSFLTPTSPLAFLHGLVFA